MSSTLTPADRASRSRRRQTGLAAALLLALVLLLASAVTAGAAPATVRVVGWEPSLGHDVAVALPGGGSFTADPGRTTLQVTPATGGTLTTAAWCVDPARGIDDGVDYPVDLTSSDQSPDLATPAALEAAWLMGRADDLIAASATPGREAAAIQVAVWQLVGEAADVHAVTGDAGLNARVAELRAMAAGRSPATAIALAAPPNAVVAEPVALTVTGTPGTTVTLTASRAALSTDVVQIGAGGTASVVVTPTAPGDVTVTARAQGGLLWRAAHLPHRATPQDMAYVAPRELAATVTLTVATPPVLTPPPPQVVTPPTVAPTAVRPAALRIAKRAPRRVVRGRVITYRLTVRNVSSRTARAVVVRDRLPARTAVTRRPSRARIVGRTVVWRLGDLAPRARRTVLLRLRTYPATRARVVNVAAASASNAATVRARAVTRVRAPVRVAPVVVPVTG